MTPVCICSSVPITVYLGKGVPPADFNVAVVHPKGSTGYGFFWALK